MMHSIYARNLDNDTIDALLHSVPGHLPFSMQNQHLNVAFTIYGNANANVSSAQPRDDLVYCV